MIITSVVPYYISVLNFNTVTMILGKNQYECIRDAIDYLYKRAGMYLFKWHALASNVQPTAPNNYMYMYIMIGGTLDMVTLRKSLFMLSGK